MSAGRRAAGSVISQGLSSGQSFLLLFIALRWLDLHEVGQFTLIYTTATLVLTVARSLVLEPLLIRYSGSRELSSAAPRAIGASALLGVSVLVIVTLGLSLLGGSRDITAILAAAGALPAILVQDGFRFAMFAGGRPWQAAANDAVVFILTAGLVVVVAKAGEFPIWWIFVGWGVACVLSVFVAMGHTRSVPSLRGGIVWLRENGRIGWQLAGSTAAQQAAGRVSLYLVGAIAGVAALGVVAAARTLFSPLNMMLAASVAFAVPEGSRRRADGRALDRFLLQVSLTLFVLVATVLIALHWIPDDVGRFVAGANWQAAEPILIPTALWIGGTALSQGARIGLRVVDGTRTLLTGSIAVGALVVVGATVGAASAGAAGAAWGFGLVSLLVQVLWWSAYRRVRSRGANRNDQ